MTPENIPDSYIKDEEEARKMAEAENIKKDKEKELDILKSLEINKEKNLLKKEKESEEPQKNQEGKESEDTISSSLKSVRKIASETGKFYNSLIDTYLEFKTPKEQQEQIERLIEILPNHMKKLYREGVKRLQEEIEKNYTLLKEHQGEEIRYLLSSWMTSQKRNTEEIEQILHQVNRAQFVEPSPGIAIIVAEEDFFELLQEHDIIPDGGQAVHFRGNYDHPSFIIIQRIPSGKSLTKDTSWVKENTTLRHEFHHFIWHFLERRGDYLRKVSESSPKLTKAFRSFRNELAAYLIEKRPTNELIEPVFLTYMKDDEIFEVASDARNFAMFCINVAKQKNVDPQNFLYACMTSKNFSELKNNFAILTPLDKIDAESIAILYSVWSKTDSRVASKITEFLEKKNLSTPINLVEEYGLNYMISSDLTSMDQVFSKIKKIKEFARVIGSGFINEQRLLEKVAQTRLPLPKETIGVILSLPSEQSKFIPLDKSGEDFLKSFISFWRINQDSVRAVYKRIINSSFVMRDAFEKVRVEIANKGAESYRREFRSTDEERNKQIESEIQKRIQLLMEL